MKMVNTYLLKRAAAGEEIVIARAGRPVARLVPLEGERQSRELGFVRGELRIADDFDAPLPADVLEAFAAVTALAVQHSHAFHVGGLPLRHTDPFDRLLVAQAQLEDVPVLTSDSAFSAYDIEVLPA